MHLYEIANTHNQAFLEMADMEDLPEEVINDTLEALQGSFNDKAISVAAFFMNMDADIQAMKDAEKRIADRRKAKEGKVKWMKDYLLINMQRTGITKIECPQFAISLRTNPESVHIVDESLIPNEFKIIETVTKIDKNAIKKAGGCPGTELIRAQSINIK
jgi:trehalose-6-phosphatase